MTTRCRAEFQLDKIDLEGLLEIVWQRADLLRNSMGRDFRTIEALFKEVGDEREYFSFQLVNS